MRIYLTEKEITDKLKNLKIIADTREQVNSHVKEHFDSKKIETISRKLDIGDYSAMIDDYTLENSVVVERKASIDEIAGNYTVDRKRFENEFLRAKANGVKVFLIIEGCSWGDIYLHNYRSKLKPQSLIASLLAWQIRYNVTVFFCKPSETGQIIHGLLHYAAREALKRGAIGGT